MTHERASGSPSWVFWSAVTLAVTLTVAFVAFVFARGAHPPYAEMRIEPDLPLIPGDQISWKKRDVVYTLTVLSIEPDGAIKADGRGDGVVTYKRGEVVVRRVTRSTSFEPGDVLLVKRAAGWARYDVVRDDGPTVALELVGTREPATLDKAADVAVYARAAWARDGGAAFPASPQR